MSNFHSSFSTATKNCLIPSSVSSSLEECGRKVYVCEGVGVCVCMCVRVQEDCVYMCVRVWERESLPFDKDLNGISHKLSCHFQNIVR